MEYIKRQEEYKLIAALLHDIHMSNAVVFNTKSLENTLKQVQSRIRFEGISFLTKTLPKIGKALDKALACERPFTAIATVTAKSLKSDSELPILMEEFSERVFDKSGAVLNEPCVLSIGILRQFYYLFYKYELPYSVDQEQQVISKFIKTESDLSTSDEQIRRAAESVEWNIRKGIMYPRQCDVQNTKLNCYFEMKPYDQRDGTSRDFWFENQEDILEASKSLIDDRELHKRFLRSRILRRARRLLERVFRGFELKDICPQHGPGAVATKQTLWEKYQWTNVSHRLRRHFPLDEFFFVNLDHVCDCVSDLEKITDKDLPAKVILVPKDSRGPRLISCEPVDFQWIQQGIMRKLVKHVETHFLTRENVFFTNQEPNRGGALAGSATGRYATLDLNEASDRISTELVKSLFPSHVFDVLQDCRTRSTKLPNGRVINLNKFAPMGSALCFPLLALTVWAILAAGASDKHTRERIFVYGDDVIVPTAHAENAIEQLELFGLKVNRDKSCTKGFFRESCGMDAYKGYNVTPVRFRTVWSSVRSPDIYTSWIAYANSMFDRRYYAVYNQIVDMLWASYGPIPSDDMQLACPSLRWVADSDKPSRTRINRPLQKREWKVWDVKAPNIKHEMNGWLMLMRFFVESSGAQPLILPREEWLVTHSGGDPIKGFPVTRSSVSSYTRRGTSMLVRRWR